MKKQTTRKQALLVGAVVYDALFELSSAIGDQIVVTNGKPGKQNLMFSANAKQVYFGGPSGNIAYGLAQQGYRPLLASVAGRDFGEYAAHLKKLGVQSRVVRTNGHTAMFYGVTDTKKEQLGIFQGNSYHQDLAKFPLSKLLTKTDWKNIGVGIFSPGTAQSSIRDLMHFRAETKKLLEKPLAIFDPGQMLAVDFTPELFAKAVQLSDILIVNDSEAHFMRTKLGFTHEKLWSLGLQSLVVTHGAEGSVLHTKDGTVKVQPTVAKKVIDPTGAGDAYRAGLISGILSGKTILQSMEIGSRLGARCVARFGGQTY